MFNPNVKSEESLIMNYCSDIRNLIIFADIKNNYDIKNESGNR